MAADRRNVFPVVGVIHLPPLPGSVRGGSARQFSETLAIARRDANAWASGGAAALIVENFGDVPFVRDAVAPHVVAAMTVVVETLRRDVGLPIGVNVLRNDVLAAVSIAAMAGGSFVRANVYVGAALTDQGVIEGRAHDVQALIRRLDAPVTVWADVDVKHAAQLAPRPLGDLAADAVERGLAGALIVSGRATGQPAALDDLRQARQAAPTTPLYVGSGATMARMRDLLAIADGAIVGTAAKVDGDVANPVDPARARALVDAAEAARGG